MSNVTEPPLPTEPNTVAFFELTRDRDPRPLWLTEDGNWADDWGNTYWERELTYIRTLATPVEANDRRTEPASGQPDGWKSDVALDAFIVRMVKAAEDRAKKYTDRHISITEEYVDAHVERKVAESVARIRAEGYITVDTLVEALNAEGDYWLSTPNQTFGAFAKRLVDAIAQGGQPQTEKEGS